MELNVYNVKIHTVKDEEIEVKARSEAEALDKAEGLTLASSLTGIDIKGISKQNVSMSCNTLKKSKTQVIINA